MQTTTYTPAEEVSTNGNGPRPLVVAGRQIPDLVLVGAAVAGMAVAGLALAHLSGRLSELAAHEH